MKILSALCLLAVGCGGVGDPGLFGAGGASASSVSVAASASSETSVSSSSSSSASGDPVSSAFASSSATSSTSGGTSFFWASGVQQNVNESELTGWSKCYSGHYDSVSDALPSCPGSKMLLACRPVGASVFSLVAMANSADVLFDTGVKVHDSHEANGIAWYFNPDHAWGFAPGGDDVATWGCDLTGIDPSSPGPDGEKRLCWTTAQGNLSNGYRCGFNSWQNTPGFDSLYERVVYSAP